MLYAVVLTENNEFVPFPNQEELKNWIKNNTDLLYMVVEYQVLDRKIETVVTLKRPGVTRSS